MQQKLTPGRLLDADGALAQRGWATSLVREYSRADIKAGQLRIKEWDYYLVTNDRFGVALTIDDNSYMGLVSASFLDFENGRERTVSPMSFMPRGRTGFPASSAAGDVSWESKTCKASFAHVENGRRLYMKMDNFEGDTPFEADITLTDAPRDSMVIATPFPKKKTAFYYNQKIVGMRASGWCAYNGKKYVFEPDVSFGLLDWGRGVWTYDNTWYWGAGQVAADGHVLGWNIGYGFGDTSAASENMLFYDGIAHKLEGVSFNIPKNDGGGDDFLSPWTFSSTDGRFEASFTPILDRASCTNVGVIMSDQHQVFGHLDGYVVLDDGRRIELKHYLGMAEKVRNKW